MKTKCLVVVCAVLLGGACEKSPASKSQAAGSPAVDAPVAAKADEEKAAFLADLKGIAETMKAYSIKIVAALEAAGDDCDKAAANVMATDAEGQIIKQATKEFGPRARKHPEWQEEMSAIMTAAIPSDVRETLSALEKALAVKCKDHAAFQTARASIAFPRKQRPDN
ncbi:MAG: hypothetical protein IPL79_15455 [Myxococcales bacterium]|nr:hypothetical protein [Myxococcales bacterium]